MYIYMHMTFSKKIDVFSLSTAIFCILINIGHKTKYYLT